jgi:hypothetical protein
MAKAKARCRHSASWLMTVSGVGFEWCWGCGALRKLREGTAGYGVISDWAYPGRGKNPWAKFADSIVRRERREGAQ